MTDPAAPAEPEEVTAGWLFMTANSLGLSDADLAHVLNVRPDTIRKHWKYGTQPVPDGVRRDLRQFIEFTEAAIDVIVSRAQDAEQPAIVVYPNLRDVPAGHLAAEYGITWWDHVAFAAQQLVPEIYVGYLMEVAAAYGYPPADAMDVHDDPAVLAIYSGTTTRTRANRLA